MSERVEFRNTSLPVDVMAYPSSVTPGVWVVKASLDGPDRETGKPGSFAVEHRRTFEGTPDTARLARWARAAVADILMHELAEALHVDGVRVFDPHKGAQ